MIPHVNGFAIVYTSDDFEYWTPLHVELSGAYKPLFFDFIYFQL